MSTDKHQHRRNRAIKLAVITSVLSKFGTALLQLVSIPIAIRVLGREEFGLYTTISMTITMALLLELGIGPALTHGISSAVAKEDQKKQRIFYSTSFFMVLGLALIGFLALASIIHWVPITSIFGSKYAGFEDKMVPALWIGIAAVVAVLVLNHTSRAREGYLEANYNNAWGASGNLVSAALVAGGIFLFPTINFLILAIFGAQILAHLGNTIHLWKQRPFLIPSPKLVRRDTGAHLFKDGIAFSASFMATGIVEFNLCTLIVGWIAGPSEVSLYGVLATLTISLLGFVMMFTSPLWPSVVDANERHDLDWIRRTSRKLYRYSMAYALAVALGISLLGPFLMPIWLGSEFSNIPILVLIAYGSYFMAHVWRHANHMLLVGMGKVKRAAVFQITESLTVIGTAWLGMALFGIAGLLGFTTITVLGITGWIFPRMFVGALEDRQRAGREEERRPGAANSSSEAIGDEPGLGIEGSR